MFQLTQFISVVRKSCVRSFLSSLQFQLILNVAVGGLFFRDAAKYNSPKPWRDNSATPMKNFWEGRSSWQPSWQGDDVAMMIDYVEMIEY